MIIWRNKLSKKRITIEFKNKVLSMMRNLIQYGIDVYNLPTNLLITLREPFKDYAIKIHETKQVIYTDDEFNKFLETFDNSYLGQLYKLLFSILYYTGLRIGAATAKVTVKELEAGTAYTLQARAENRLEEQSEIVTRDFETQRLPSLILGAITATADGAEVAVKTADAQTLFWACVSASEENPKEFTQVEAQAEMTVKHAALMKSEQKNGKVSYREM